MSKRSKKPSPAPSPLRVMAERLAALHARKAALYDLGESLKKGAVWSGVDAHTVRHWLQGIWAEEDALQLAMLRSEPATLADAAMMLVAFALASDQWSVLPEDDDASDEARGMRAMFAAVDAVMWKLVRHCRADLPAAFVETTRTERWQTHGPASDEIPDVAGPAAAVEASRMKTG